MRTPAPGQFVGVIEAAAKTHLGLKNIMRPGGTATNSKQLLVQLQCDHGKCATKLATAVSDVISPAFGSAVKNIARLGGDGVINAVDNAVRSYFCSSGFLPVAAATMKAALGVDVNPGSKVYQEHRQKYHSSHKSTIALAKYHSSRRSTIALTKVP